MLHLKALSAPRMATIIEQDPDGNGGGGVDGGDIISIIESFFGFVFEYVEIKGKSA